MTGFTLQGLLRLTPPEADPRSIGLALPVTVTTLSPIRKLFDRSLPIGCQNQGAGKETDKIGRRALYGLPVTIVLIGQYLKKSSNVKNEIAGSVCCVVRTRKAGVVAVRVSLKGAAGCKGAGKVTVKGAMSSSSGV